MSLRLKCSVMSALGLFAKSRVIYVMMFVSIWLFAEAEATNRPSGQLK